MKFLRILYYSNFFYALCAASQVIFTLGLNSVFDSWPIILVISSLAYLAYCIPFFIQVLSKDKLGFEYPLFYVYSLAIPLGTLVSLGVLFFLRSEIFKLDQVWVLSTIAITFFYFIASRFGKFIGWTKPFLIATAWFIATILLVPNNQGFFIAIFRYLIFFLVAFYFDAMDINADKLKNRSTFATLLGFEKSKSLAIGLSMTMFMLAVIASFFAESAIVWISLCISPLIIYKLAEVLFESRDSFMSRFIADVSLIFPTLIMILLNLLTR